MNIFKSKTVLLGLAVAFIPFLQALQALPLTDMQSSALTSAIGFIIILNRLYGTPTVIK